MTGLTFLELGPGISQAGALRLQTALPNCVVQCINANGQYVPLKP
jgi:hypothetical protein